MLYPLRDWPDYSITPEGQVWSHKRNKWLSIFPKKHYYHAVKLSHNGVSKQLLIHTLVGRTFLPYVEGAKILHRDETLPFPDIHYLSNLWVGSMKDNSEDMVAKNRVNRSNPGAAPSVFLEYKGEVKSQAEWARDLGIHCTTLYSRVEKWGIEKALTTPKNEYMDRHKKGSRRTTNETS